MGTGIPSIIMYFVIADQDDLSDSDLVHYNCCMKKDNGEAD